MTEILSLAILWLNSGELELICLIYLFAQRLRRHAIGHLLFGVRRNRAATEGVFAFPGMQKGVRNEQTKPP